jgi:protein subunit release factor B
MALPIQIGARLATLGTSPADVEERFVRGSGPGGQKINKTSSTVQLRHRPTGIEVRCQGERSQAQNRTQAWLTLCARLEERNRVAAAAAVGAREAERRRGRRKSAGQRARMVADKRHRAGCKAARGRVGPE